MMEQRSRPRLPARIAALLALAAALALAATQPAWPQAGGDIFTVSDVAVDVTAQTAAEARERAIVEGQGRALETVLRRLTRQADHERLPPVSGATAAQYLQDFQVENERISSVRYLADLTFRFNAAEVRRLLRQANIPYAETASRPVLVLPLLLRGNELRLWEEPNPWRDAWAQMPPRDSLVPMVVPFGDLEDITAVDAEQAAGGDLVPLAAIASRYGATDTVVVTADVDLDPGQLVPVANVTVARIGTTAHEPFTVRITGVAREPIDPFLERAASATATAIIDDWITANLLRFDSQQRMAVTVPFDAPADWVAVRTTLDRIAVISDWRLEALRANTVELELVYIGDEEQLRQALAQSNLVLEQPFADDPFLPRAENGGARILRRTNAFDR